MKIAFDLRHGADWIRHRLSSRPRRETTWERVAQNLRDLIDWVTDKCADEQCSIGQAREAAHLLYASVMVTAPYPSHMTNFLV